MGMHSDVSIYMCVCVCMSNVMCIVCKLDGKKHLLALFGIRWLRRTYVVFSGIKFGIYQHQRGK